MLTIRKAADRFHTDAGWLDSWHTFSFGGHYDERFTGFRSLLVINDDTVAANGGFPTHGHRDMEIISYVIDGALGHKDSMGNGSVIVPGDVQRMSAGTGVRHSEMNAEKTKATHFLQIWITPEYQGQPPSYEQKHFSIDDKRDRLRLVAGPDGTDGAVTIHQDASMYASVLTPGVRVEHKLGRDRHAWIHVVRGNVKINNETQASTGDGVAISQVAMISIEALSDAEVLLFDLV